MCKKCYYTQTNNIYNSMYKGLMSGKRWVSACTVLKTLKTFDLFLKKSVLNFYNNTYEV